MHKEIKEDLLNILKRNLVRYFNIPREDQYGFENSIDSLTGDSMFSMYPENRFARSYMQALPFSFPARLNTYIEEVYRHLGIPLKSRFLIIPYFVMGLDIFRNPPLMIGLYTFISEVEVVDYLSTTSLSI